MDRLTARIEVMMEPFQGFRYLMLVAIWHMGTTGTLYEDPSADFFTRLHPDLAQKRAIGHLDAMGYTVTLDHAS